MSGPPEIEADGTVKIDTRVLLSYDYLTIKDII